MSSKPSASAFVIPAFSGGILGSASCTYCNRVSTKRALGSKKARSLDPRASNTHYFLAAAYGVKGERELARAELAEAMRLTGSDRYSSVVRIRVNGDLYTPALRDRMETVFFPGIRAAGLPEE